MWGLSFSFGEKNRPPSPRFRAMACRCRDSWRYFWRKKTRSLTVTECTDSIVKFRTEAKSKEQWRLDDGESSGEQYSSCWPYNLCKNINVKRTGGKWLLSFSYHWPFLCFSNRPRFARVNGRSGGDIISVLSVGMLDRVIRCWLMWQMDSFIKRGPLSYTLCPLARAQQPFQTITHTSTAAVDKIKSRGQVTSGLLFRRKGASPLLIHHSVSLFSQKTCLHCAVWKGQETHHIQGNVTGRTIVLFLPAWHSPWHTHPSFLWNFPFCL